MKVTCIADLHGFYPKLPGGDLLIVAGDLTARDTRDEHVQFQWWLAEQKYRHRVVIAGNHDNQLVLLEAPMKAPRFDYLCDSGTEFEGLKIWGSPWTKTFPGMNPHCKAFTVDTEEELAQKWALIPGDLDILVTHSPIYGMGDNIGKSKGKYIPAGSKSLQMHVWNNPPNKLHVVGHIHEAYGNYKFAEYEYVNASHVNEYYKPVNAPVEIEL